MNKILRVRHFSYFFHFHYTLFSWLAGACVNSGSIFSNSLFVYSLVSPITHSFLDGYQPNLVRHLHPKYALPIILPKKALVINVFVKGYCTAD